MKYWLLEISRLNPVNYPAVNLKLSDKSYYTTELRIVGGPALNLMIFKKRIRAHQLRCVLADTQFR
jgi:hypothetical protein